MIKMLILSELFFLAQVSFSYHILSVVRLSVIRLSVVRLSVVCLSVVRLLVNFFSTFSTSSSEPLVQFQPNLAQRIIG